LGVDTSQFEYRPPIDLANARLRILARALGPAYIRVAGTWANSIYFADSDAPPAKAPDGFKGVLTREQWRGVIGFARATDAQIMTSFAISPGVRDRSGAWTPDMTRRWLAYTRAIGGMITAAEFMNEPSIAGISGAPSREALGLACRNYRCMGHLNSLFVGWNVRRMWPLSHHEPMGAKGKRPLRELCLCLRTAQTRILPVTALMDSERCERVTADGRVATQMWLGSTLSAARIQQRSDDRRRTDPHCCANHAGAMGRSLV
jgi:hypothetical protein